MWARPDGTTALWMGLLLLNRNMAPVKNIYFSVDMFLTLHHFCVCTFVIPIGDKYLYYHHFAIMFEMVSLSLSLFSFLLSFLSLILSLLSLSSLLTWTSSRTNSHFLCFETPLCSCDITSAYKKSYGEINMLNLMVEDITILFYIQATPADESKYLGHPRYEVM